MELETLDFHVKVAEGYRELAGKSPDRIYTIDATLSIEDIHKIIVDKIEEILNNMQI